MLRLCLNAVAISVSLGIATPALAVSTAGLFGEYWNAVNDTNDNLFDALDIIASRPADQTFVSTALDYPNGADDTLRSDLETLGAFLGADAASLSGGADTPLNSEFILRLTGQITLPPGQRAIEVASDDGFRLTIDGVIVDQEAGLRGFGSNGAVSFDAPGGPLDFELIYFDGLAIAAGLEVFVDGVIADSTILSTPMVIPLPAGVILLLTGVAGFALVRRAA